MTDHIKLAEELEAAEGPSIELFERVVMQMFPSVRSTKFDFDRFWKLCDLEAWLDAAMTLVPEGWEWSLEGEETERHFPPSDWLYKAEVGSVAKGEGSTPALALASAALKAGE